MRLSEFCKIVCNLIYTNKIVSIEMCYVSIVMLLLCKCTTYTSECIALYF